MKLKGYKGKEFGITPMLTSMDFDYVSFKHVTPADRIITVGDIRKTLEYFKVGENDFKCIGFICTIEFHNVKRWQILRKIRIRKCKEYINKHRVVMTEFKYRNT
jgi:hypothetical protein